MAPVICVAVSHPALSFDLERWFMAENPRGFAAPAERRRDALIGKGLNDCVYSLNGLLSASAAPFTIGNNASHASD
jgi:hypothetical protein